MPAWLRLRVGLSTQVSRLHDARPGYVEAHQFRIDTSDGIGRPTPEGAHRDGVDFVAVLLVDRSGIRGAETRVFDANGPDGQRFTLEQPWSLRSEEHTSELQSLMRISYAVFCLKKKKLITIITHTNCV